MRDLTVIMSGERSSRTRDAHARESGASGN